MEYDIGGKTFELKPLVLGQIKQISELFEDVNLLELFEKDLDVFIKVVSRKLPRFLAIILREPDKSLKEKNIDELSEFFEENVGIDLAMRIIKDFFKVNEIRSLIQQITMPIQADTEAETGLRNSSSLSQTETSQKEKQSFGTQP